MWQGSPNQNNILLGANNIQWANTITLEKTMFFFPKFVFSYEWTLEKNVLQLVIINSYSCPSTWYVISSSFLLSMNLLKCHDSL